MFHLQPILNRLFVFPKLAGRFLAFLYYTSRINIWVKKPRLKCLAKGYQKIIKKGRILQKEEELFLSMLSRMNSNIREFIKYFGIKHDWVSLRKSKYKRTNWSDFDARNKNIKASIRMRPWALGEVSWMSCYNCGKTTSVR